MSAPCTTIYLVHHSHTDIGYTDFQESALFNQVEYLRWLIRRIKQGYADNTPARHTRWTCETFCMVERFLAVATPAEQEDFFDLVRRGNIGISASYLNFTDLVDIPALHRRTAEAVQLLKRHGHTVTAAMNADINGVSMGMRDLLLQNGIRFLMTNINTHHGLYPLHRRLQPFFWENDKGERLLVFCADHYHIGNLLGLENHDAVPSQEALEQAEQKLSAYIADARAHGYTYDFFPMCISGALRDNGPPNVYLAHMAEAMNARYPHLRIEPVTIEQLYERTRDKLADAPIYRGDFTDWWANGVGSMPYATRHYRDAQRRHRLNALLDPEGRYSDAALTRQAEDNLFLYAEHTFGFNCSIGEPYRNCVYDSQLRKFCYASKASEAANTNYKHICYALGDRLLYHHRNGYVKVINPTQTAGTKVVSFVVETAPYQNFTVTEVGSGRQVKRQQFPHPKGLQIFITDHFEAGQSKVYAYAEQPAEAPASAYPFGFAGDAYSADVAADAAQNGLYGLENDWLRITYQPEKGITSVFSKADQAELLTERAPLFTPIYEVTPVRSDARLDRFHLGRNICGVDAHRCYGTLRRIVPVCAGEVFQQVELHYDLEGTEQCCVELRLYRDLPRIDCTLRLAKKLCSDIESVYLPLTLDLPQHAVYLDKGGVPMRPGIDQLPGTCMEFYVADNGILYRGEGHCYLLSVKDAPLVYTGPLQHHPIRLCVADAADNKRDIYSWVMNNMWDTNFMLDLSGFSEFRYSLSLTETADLSQNFALLAADNLELPSFGILDPNGNDDY